MVALELVVYDRVGRWRVTTEYCIYLELSSFSDAGPVRPELGTRHGPGSRCARPGMLAP